MNSHTDEEHHSIPTILEHISHYLPSQRPLEAFVHHNTLHAFEDYTFEEGVRMAQDLYGSAAYMPEEQFRGYWKTGRIQRKDIFSVLEKRIPPSKAQPTFYGKAGLALELPEIIFRWMLHQPTIQEERSANWLREERNFFNHWPEDQPRDAFERLNAGGKLGLNQTELWNALEPFVFTTEKQLSSTTKTISRPRDGIVHQHKVDIDEWIHPKLIHWCKAYLDREYSLWSVEDTNKGLFYVVMKHLASGIFHPRWMQPLKQIAIDIVKKNISAEQAIKESIHRMGWDHADIHDMLQSMMLALPGWAGIFEQLRLRPDLSPFALPPMDLINFAAVRVLLEESASVYICTKQHIPSPTMQIPSVHTGNLHWRLFYAMRLLGIKAKEVVEHPAVIKEIYDLLTEWDSIARQGIWQNAYERRYRIQTFDALLTRSPVKSITQPKAQVVFCIDDREESIRRYIEEIDPDYQTFGFAGFFGVAMYFQPYNSPIKRPLCPAFNIPKHVVKESDDNKQLSSFPETSYRGTNTLLRGLGFTLANVGRLLPLAKDVLSTKSASLRPLPPPIPKTTVHFRADNPPKMEDGLQVGYTVQEMTAIVKKFLEDVGMVKIFAPFVFILGHGSDSANNPHGAAYDCGACGGGKGSPNARIFAAMANDPEVRSNLAGHGIHIPPSTHFVGGYHNTSSDILEYYDVDSVPSEKKSALETIQQDLLLAAKKDAHERSRRFESIPLDVSVEEAYRRVQLRAKDIAEPRPECGHATNALCFVGKRQWSKGIFFDRRAFLVSYDSDIDHNGAIVRRILSAVGPVGAGINLEYYFSYVDPNIYGANTKLPHNVASLLGVMNGQESDLITGLPWQMVEIHEPMRLLNIIESTPEKIAPILEAEPYLKKLIVNRWILAAVFDPKQHKLWYFDEEGFVEYTPEDTDIPHTDNSFDWYNGQRDHLLPSFIKLPSAKIKENTI